MPRRSDSPWQTSLGPIATREPLYLGIVNVTPDSFSDGGCYLAPEAALAQARNLLAQGAGALDVGAESTRPDAEPVSADLEWARLEPVLALLRAELPQLPISLDTRHASVAARGLQAGVAIINDVTGFKDPELLHVARNSGCGVIAMRSRSQDDQLHMPPYGQGGSTSAKAAIAELAAVKARLLEAGIQAPRILLDPGFGFGLPFTEDLALWDALPSLPGALSWPVQNFCLGVSRKRLLAWRAGNPALPPAQRDALTARAHHQATALGYRVFRSHTGPRPAIRLAQAEDAEALAQVQINSWQAAYRDILPATLLEHLQPVPLAAAFRQQASAPPSPDCRLWVLTLGGRLCGYAATGPCREAVADDPAGADGPTAEIYALYFLKAYWGLGLGQALMAQALATFRDLGFTQVVLWVLERNARARRFYESAGWQLSGPPRTVWQGGIALRECLYRFSLEKRETIS